MMRSTAAIVLLPFAFLSIYAQSLPPLPELSLGTYAPPIRSQIEAAYEAAQKNPNDAASNGQLGMVLYANELYEFTAPCFERALTFAPKDIRWAYYLGRAQANLKRFEQAVASLKVALRLDPEYLPAQLKLAESLQEAGRTEESQKLYEAIVEKHPEESAAHYGMGRIYAARREFAPAVEHLRRACELFPNFGAAHFALARAYRDTGEADKAQEELALYEKDRLGWPTTPDPLLTAVLELRTGAMAHLRRGIGLAESGQLQAAVEEHELALAADPKLVQAHIHLIRLYGLLNRPEKAEEHFREAVALDPNRADAYYNHGALLLQQKKFDEAMEAYRKVLDLEPSHIEANNSYAFLLMTSGKLEEAARYYRAAIEAKPDYRVAHFNLGRILVQQRKFPEAIEQFLQTLEPEDQETPVYTYSLGAAYARAGDRQNALKYTKQARQKAEALGQKELLNSIDRDLKRLEPGTNPP